MNNKTDIILGYDYEAVKELANDVWHDEKPAHANNCNDKWEANFIESLAQYVKEHYETVFDLESQHPLISAFVQFDSIEWNVVAKTVFDDYIQGLIDQFIEECEREDFENMTDSERKEYYDELEGDRQYESYIDDLLQGDI
jgi:hypothetical protein